MEFSPGICEFWEAEITRGVPVLLEAVVGSQEYFQEQEVAGGYDDQWRGQWKWWDYTWTDNRNPKLSPKQRNSLQAASKVEQKQRSNSQLLQEHAKRWAKPLQEESLEAKSLRGLWHC